MTGPDPHVTQRPSPTPAAQNSLRGAPMLSVQGLTTHLELRRGTVRAVETASTCTCMRARPWAWWANPVPASP
jgi:hypothetical protein